MSKRTKKPEHTPEPWKLDGKFENNTNSVFLRDAERKTVICSMNAYTFWNLTPKKAQANAERIVACVNACAGLDNEQLKFLAQVIDERNKYSFHISQLENLAIALMKSLATYGSHPVLEEQYKVVMDNINPPMDLENIQNAWSDDPNKALVKAYSKVNATNEGGGHE